MNLIRDFGISMRLTVASWKMLFRKPVMLVLPLLTLAWTALVVLAPVNWWIWQAEHDPNGAMAFWKAVFFLPVQAYNAGNYSAIPPAIMLTWYVIQSVFMTVILTGALFVITVGMDVTTQIIKTGEGKLGPAFKLAGRNLGRIFLMALTLAFLIKWFQYIINRFTRFLPIVGRILRTAFNLVITSVVFLMLPIIIYERAGPMNAMKSAWRNVKKTWTGILVGTGIIYFAGWLLLSVIAQGFMEATISHSAPAAGKAFGFVTWSNFIPTLIIGAIVYAFSSSTAATMRATLYWYATTGEVPAGFRVDDLPKIENPSTFTIPAASASIGSRPTPTAAAPVAPAPFAPAPSAPAAAPVKAPRAKAAASKPATKPAGKSASKPKAK